MVKSEPLVSIIIPTHNRAKIIPETLDTILEQTYKNWECIIVDDSSTDNTLEVLQHYEKKDPRFNTHKRPENYKSGANGARNYGFDISNGKFIQWFDSDDLMHENMLSDKIELFSRKPNYDCIISQLYFFEERDVLKGPTEFNMKYKLLYENIITWNIQVWTQSTMFKKQFLIDTKERFDESLKRLHDYDYYSRIFIKHSPNTYLLDKPLTYIRRNSQDAITTYFFDKKNVIELEKSEYVVANKIIQLLINENKFTDNLVNFFYSTCKTRIFNLIRVSDHETVKSFKSLVSLFLKFNKSYYKLVRFHIALWHFKFKTLIAS